VRKRIEEVFGWMKTVGGLRKLRHRGGARVNWQFLFAAAAYNLVRMRTRAARPGASTHYFGRNPGCSRDESGRSRHEPSYFSSLDEMVSSGIGRAMNKRVARIGDPRAHRTDGRPCAVSRDAGVRVSAGKFEMSTKATRDFSNWTQCERSQMLPKL
jgi:hypothetical protein